ncbi:MAG TPA: SRPBCC family protein [Fimbriimonas sp.]|nr:SRPBCC family protein [Fimbriimonas sp.]
MPSIDTSIWINAPIERVYAIAKDSASYPEYMRDVQSVTLVQRDGNRVVSDYVGLVPQFLLKVRWRQEEIWDEGNHASTFRQIEGDYDELSGTWKFTEERDGVRFDQHLDYVYDVPTLGALVKKVVHGIMVKNLENIGTAIKARAEKS